MAHCFKDSSTLCDRCKYLRLVSTRLGHDLLEATFAEAEYRTAASVRFQIAVFAFYFYF